MQILTHPAKANRRLGTQRIIAARHMRRQPLEVRKGLPAHQFGPHMHHQRGLYGPAVETER